MDWSRIAVWICQGIFQALGSKAYNSLLPDGSTLSKQDLVELLSQFILKVQAIVHKELLENDKLQIEGQAAHVHNMAMMYQNLEHKKLNQLLPIIDQADALTEYASRILLTVGPFAVIGSLELAMLQEKYLLSRDEGDSKSLRQKANHLYQLTANFKSMLASYNEARFVPADGNWNDPPGVIYGLDGNWVGEGAGWDLQQSYYYRHENIKQEFARLAQQILTPLQQVADKWRQIAGADFVPLPIELNETNWAGAVGVLPTLPNCPTAGAGWGTLTNAYQFIREGLGGHWQLVPAGPYRFVTWKLTDVPLGRYKISVEYACAGDPNRDLNALVDGAGPGTPIPTGESTGGWDKFKIVDMGSLTIENANPSISVQSGREGGDWPYVKEIKLTFTGH